VFFVAGSVRRNSLYLVDRLRAQKNGVDEKVKGLGCTFGTDTAARITGELSSIRKLEVRTIEEKHVPDNWLGRRWRL